MGRRQAHGAVHADFTEALVDGVHHGVQDDEGGHDHGNEQIAEPRQRAQRHGAVYRDLSVHGSHHRDPETLHEAFDPVGGRFVRGKPDRDGAEGPAEIVHIGLRGQQDVRGGQVLERGHIHGLFVVVHQGEFGQQILARRRVVHGCERLAV